VDVTEQAAAAREPGPAVAPPPPTDQMIESLHSGGLLVLTMRLARQRSSKPLRPA
jgi:hypothetical protein